jgi:hypothetical protein
VLPRHRRLLIQCQTLEELQDEQLFARLRNPDYSADWTLCRALGWSARAFCRVAIPILGVSFFSDPSGAIFLAGCRESLPEWEIQALPGHGRGRITIVIESTRTRTFAHVGKVK